MTQSAIVSNYTPTGPIVDPKTGQPTYAFTKWLQNIGQIINQAFNSQAQLSGDSVPAPTVSTLGGILATAELLHEWVSSIDATGTPHLTQPAFSDISGTAAASQVPPLSELSGSLNASQVTGTFGAAQIPALSSLNGSVTAAQVPALSALTGRITTGQLPTGLFSGTIVTARLTLAGANGSMTFLNGSLQSEVAAT